MNFTLNFNIQLMVQQTKLTKIELEILQLIYLGLANQELAEKFLVSKDLVELRISKILEKLNASCKTEAIINAIKRSMISIQKF